MTSQWIHKLLIILTSSIQMNIFTNTIITNASATVTHTLIAKVKTTEFNLKHVKDE